MKQSPLKLLAQLDGVEALARALALEPGAILTTPPPRTADTGANHLLVRLADAATVERGAPDAPALLEVQRGVDAEGGAAEKKANALQKPLTPSADLAAVVRSGQLSRGETVAKIWDDIKANNLQNPANKREILADAKLKAVFDGNDKVSMFEMNKHLARRLK